MAQYIETEFEPDENISAHELAILIKRMFSQTKLVRFTPQQWVELDYNLKKHFRRLE